MNKTELYKIPYDFSHEKCSKNLKVGVIAAPCHGFGDVIFATKFSRYLKNFTNDLRIITPSKSMFEKLGVSDIPIINLPGNKNQCRRLASYDRPKCLPKLDLIFVAPLMADFDIRYRDIKSFLEESNPFNTIFLSEYQDDPSKGFDFTTGVGQEFAGLLFDDTKPSKKLKGLNKYVLAYIAKGVGTRDCLLNFAKMVTQKYDYLQKFEIVCPDWCVEKLSKSSTFKKFAKNHFGTLVSKTKDEEKIIYKTNKPKTLTLRGDMLPVPREDMLSLMKYSLPDILVTGDQSITDAIDCCSKKNIWYQIVPWKSSFAKALSDEMPHKYLAKESTSCGVLDTNVNLNFRGFKQRNDFRKKSFKKIQDIFCAATEAKDPKTKTYKYLKQLRKSRAKMPLIKIIEN